jgi:hypothetical protein
MSIFMPKSRNATKPQYTGLQVQTSSNSMPIAILMGTNSLAPNLIWYDNFTTITKKEKQGGKGGSVTTTTYSYTADVILALCQGPVTAVPRSWIDKEEKTELPGELFNGYDPQNPWPYLVTSNPTKALSYNGIAYIAEQDYALTDAAGVHVHSFECVGPLAETLSDIGNDDDADCALVIEQLLTNAAWGSYFPEAYISDFYLKGGTGTTSYQCYCKAMGFGLSPVLASAESSADVIQRWLDFTNSTVVWSDNVLKFIPYAETNVTGNGFTWVASTAPLYNLDDTDYVALNGDDPVKINRIDVSTMDNVIRLEIKDRANRYSVLPVECTDESAIQLYGKRVGSTITANEICLTAMASLVGQLMLQRKLYIRNQYKFTLSWEYCLLEPMDVVTLTDSRLGLNQRPVRIVELEEDDQGNLLFTAEDFIEGIGQATAYPKQSVVNNPINTGVAAPDVNTPMIYEPTSQQTNGAAQIWVAAAGSGPNWGGAEVWVSTDDATYQQLGTIEEPATQGVLTANLADYTGANPDGVNTCSVDLTESGTQMLSTSAVDAQAGVTAAVVGSEVFSYVSANLTAPFEYDLTQLYRGQFGTEPGAHATGDKYTRLDDAVEKISLPNAYIGQTLYVKFVSFNQFGLGLQDISTLTPYTYTPKGVVASGVILNNLRTGIPVNLGQVATPTQGNVNLGSLPIVGAPINLGTI